MTVQEWLGKENKLGIDIWEKKYRYQNETFEQWLDRVSGGDEDVKRLIKDKKFLFGGRILSNRGLNKHGVKMTLSNCYVISPPEDDIESIFECASKLARTYSYGGGCGIDISNLAPRGAKVNNTAKETSGAVSFMDLYSLITGLIGQNGRRGALMLSISCEHPDLEEFIDLKSDLNKCTKANISVRITDKFMVAVQQRKSFTLSFTRKETGETITKEVDAYKLFHKICEMNWNYAEPGMLFWDRIEKWNLLSCDDNFHYAGVNPCVTGDTYILTDEGYVKIKNVVDQNINIWNGYQYSSVKPRVTGYNQPMLHIKMSDGSELDCTEYHKFILSDNTRVEAKKLIIGDKLKKHYFPVIGSGEDIPEKIAYTQGFFMGDGSSESNRDRLSIKLYGEKRKVINNLLYDNCNYCKSFDGDFLTLPYKPDIFNKSFVPDTSYSIKSRLAWLSGYIDSDGTIQSNDGAISISSINKDVLLKVKYMLNTLGCNATLSVMHNECDREMPSNNGTNSTELVHCQTSYRLLMSSNTVRMLINLGLKLHRISVNPNPNRNASRFVTIEKIEKIKNCDVVYCFNEPMNHSGVFNGVLTAQCAEEPLPAGSSCLLGSINLSEFVTQNRTFDFEDFANTVDIAVKALNEVLDEGLPLHPLQEQRDSVRDWRQIGLGIFGLADMLIKMGIRYGSKESIDLCDMIGRKMAYQAIEASSLLAEEYGAYPKYDMKSVSQSAYWSKHTSQLNRDRIFYNGLRNSQLLTIAPTGTLSTMIGVSGGIEPIYANYYERKTESLHGHDEYYKVYTPIVKEYIETHGLKDDTELPYFFVTAQTLDFKERIDMQSIWQQHIDASISSTVNVPNTFTIENVEKLYLYAWKKGLKGVTIFRDGCARTGILSTNTEKESIKKYQYSISELPRGTVIKADDNCIGRKRTLHTGCGTLHCEAFFDPDNGNLLETYFSKGSSGGCNQFMIGLSRMISLSARGGIDIYSIVDQLKSSGTCPSYAVRSATKHDTSKGSCCPVAIGVALLDMYEEIQNEINEDDGSIKEEIPDVYIEKSKSLKGTRTAKCPQCGGDLIFQGGCNTCHDCGWSKCD